MRHCTGLTRPPAAVPCAAVHCRTPQGVGVKEMAAGDAPVVGVADSFPGPGKYTVDIPCPRSQVRHPPRV